MTDLTSTRPDRLARLLDKLTARDGFERLDEAGATAFAANPGLCVLLFVEDPASVPESWDVGVVLPDLLKDLGHPCRAGVVPPDAGRALRARYGFSRWPAAVFLRDGGYLGTVEGMRDWPVFVAEVRQILASPVRRLPGIGVAVQADHGSPACH